VPTALVVVLHGCNETADQIATASGYDALAARWNVDRARVYAIGISVGAFESAILGADYPDLFAAIGINSGAAYIGGCLAPGERPTDTGALARAALAAMGALLRLTP
jgi:poly(3-hydroxybutyrate) depolymerase